jgi:hypothetical protein
MSLLSDRSVSLLLLAAAIAAGPVVEVAAQTTAFRWQRREPFPVPDTSFLVGSSLLTARDLVRGVNVMVVAKRMPSGVFELGTWEWAESRWCRRAVASPPGLRSAAIAWHGGSGRILLYGATQQWAAQTWLYDGVTWTQAANGAGPGPRTNCSLGADFSTGSVLLFGGRNQWNSLLDDTWEWNGSGWLPRSAITSPSPRENVKLNFNPTTGRMALFAGNQVGFLGLPTSLNISQVWEWTGNTWLAINSSNPIGNNVMASASCSAPGGSGVWAATNGSQTAELRRWNGVSWTTMTTLQPPMYIGGLIAEGPDHLLAYSSSPNWATSAYTPSSNQWQTLQTGGYPAGSAWTFACVEPSDSLLFRRNVGLGYSEFWRLEQGGAFTPLFQAVQGTNNPYLMSFHPPSGQVLLLNPYTGDSAAVVGSTVAPSTPLTVPVGLPYLVGHHPGSGKLLALVMNAQQQIEVHGWAPSTWTLLATGPTINDSLVGAWDGGRNRLVFAAQDGTAAGEWDGTTFTTIPLPPGPGSSYQMLPHPEGGVARIHADAIHRWDGVAWTTATILNPMSQPTGSAGLPMSYDVKRRRWLAHDAHTLLELQPAALAVDDASPQPGQWIHYAFERAASANRTWVIALSSSDAPGIPWQPSPWYGTEVIPLANDWLLGPSLGWGLGGVLDAQGRGQVALPIPNLTWLIGFRFVASALTAGTAQPFEFVSPPVEVVIRR